MVTNLDVQANLLCGKIAWNGYGYVSLRILIFQEASRFFN